MDTESLLKLLNAHEVRYVVIGVLRLPVYPSSRLPISGDHNARPANLC